MPVNGVKNYYLILINSIQSSSFIKLAKYKIFLYQNNNLYGLYGYTLELIVQNANL